MSNPKASIQFLSFVVKESHIVFNKVDNYKIEFGFTPKGTIIKSLKQFILLLSVNIRDIDNGFNIDITTESTFSYPAGANIEEYKTSLFITNAPAIIFPYIRAYIASLTALSGLPTLTMPTLNLSKLGESLKTKMFIEP
jgi:preprotein translocase subunit SecB